MYKLLFFFASLLMNFHSGFCQDSTQRVELNTIEITATMPVSHVLTNYKNWLSIHRWSVGNRDSEDVKQNLCFLTRMTIPDKIYISEIGFKIPYTDTMTHALNCIIIQNDRIIFKRRIQQKTFFLNNHVYVDSARGLMVRKGDFYIGIAFADKCTGCPFLQKFVPDFGENNFIGVMPESTATNEFNTAKLEKIQVGLQYKIIYNKEDGK